ncbi:hypothetical protein RR48_09134 [Papilio machaon]|uniref:Sulfakinin n=1 Tax=Papilio machaon TaxID=76193 RepID=A0A194RBY1_PAPMA|nr:hypothetical protein RR48_09134 [Papilio machaon]
MRLVTLIGLALVVALAASFQWCEGAVMRGAGLADDDEYRARRLYREYGMRRAARADDSFDDYGHLRFGRSDD